MGGTELDYVHEAFDTNWIAPLGANVNGFEEDLARYTGRKHAAAITTGTAGIHLGLILCGVQPGDEVFCQSFTFAASANPVRYQGAVPVFIDSEPETWNMCPDLLEEALAERAGVRASADDSPEHLPGSSGELPGGSSHGVRRQENLEALWKDSSQGRDPAIRPIRRTDRMKPGLPKAIIVVHLYGMPAKMDRIMEIANRYGVPVIEDSAEALGSSISGRKCGTYGKVSVLSFNGNKIITTSGGGALLSDDEELVNKARFLATQARDDAPHYQHSELGYNYRMSNIVAGIGRGQMEVLDERVAARRANHQFYFENLGRTWWQPSSVRRQEDLEALPTDSGHRVQDTGFGKDKNSPPSQGGARGGSPTGIYFLPEPAGYFSNRWLTTILVNPEETGGVTREDIRLALEEENIESRPLWKPMHMQPLYEGCEFYAHPSTVGFPPTIELQKGKTGTSTDDSKSSVESSRSEEEQARKKPNAGGRNYPTDEANSSVGGLSGWLFDHGLCLPSGSNLTDEDRNRVLKAINKALGRE